MTQKTFSEIFLKLLKNDSDPIGGIYYHLFSLLSAQPDTLEDMLKIAYEMSRGKGEYKKGGYKDNWFAVWHKSVRQTDVFQGCFQKRTIEILTPEERKTHQNFLTKFIDAGTREEKDALRYVEGYDGECTENYKEYLRLNNLKIKEKENFSIDGHLDSILYETVCLDNEDFLYGTFVRLFTEYELQLKS